MDPTSLEELLFLYFNKDLWENASIIDKAVAGGEVATQSVGAR